MLKPTYTTSQIADYLDSGYWISAGTQPHHFNTSTITFNCTTGEIARLARAPPLLTDVPALDSTGLALLIMLLGLAGAAALRFRRRAARAVR